MVDSTWQLKKTWSDFSATLCPPVGSGILCYTLFKDVCPTDFWYAEFCLGSAISLQKHAFAIKQAHDKTKFEGEQGKISISDEINQVAITNRKRKKMGPPSTLAAPATTPPLVPAIRDVPCTPERT